MTADPVWVIGHLTVDDIVFCDGRTRMGTLGGAALYAAIGARFAGAPARLVSRRGRGLPANALNRLDDISVATSLAVTGGAAIQQWVLYEADGSRSYHLHPGSGSLDAMSPAPNEHLIPDGAAVHLAPMPVEHQRSWCAALAARGARLTLDPHADSSAEDPASVLALLTALRAFLPSELEARPLAGDDPVAAVRAFRAAGVPIAGVKLGDAGSVIGFGDEVWHVPALPVTVQDVTGAGDAFCGGFAAALSRGCDALTAARWATAAASFVVETVGTAFPPEFFDHAAAADRMAAATPVRLFVESGTPVVPIDTARKRTV